MPQGGARVRSGPPPDPNALRRDRPSDQASWTDLPPRREGAPPEWPTYIGEPHPDSMQAQLWAELWSMPQAVMWERQRRHIEVALYVDTLVAIQNGPPPDVKTDPTPTLRALAIRQQATLVLTSESLNRHRWRITEDVPREATRKNGDRRTSADKARFTRIEGGRTAG